EPGIGGHRPEHEGRCHGTDHGASGPSSTVRRSALYRVPGMSGRVLLLSWEYPPVIEGGLARHVRKLAESLVRQGMTVDVLTRGAHEGPGMAGSRPAALAG